MIVRESPKAKRSPDKNTANWPPKSPYEALLSSPSGRQKWQERRNQLRQRTPSPSPRRPLNKSPHGALSLGDPFESGGEDVDVDEEDEDEETLQLKLQAIEAKLKLKKLQQAKAKQSADTASLPGSVRSVNPSPRKRLRLNEDVQVPVSPTRVQTQTEPVVHTSPARVLLGIDKGLRAQDVSLKRARPAGASVQKPNLHREPPRIKSFTERLADSRSAQVERQLKDERIYNARGQGFGLKNLPKQESSATQALWPRPNFEIAAQKPSLLESAREKVSTTPVASRPTAVSSLKGSADAFQPQPTMPPLPQTERQRKAAQKRADDAVTLEPFSSLHLSKRQFPHNELASALSGKELFPIPRLLKEIKSPDYYPPDCEADYVAFGVISSKSSPFDAKNRVRTADSDPSSDKKFMVLHLTDLKWELDLFLFGSAFTKYWKLTVGTVVAILNPGIMPPRPHLKDTGRFCLKLSSSGDEILELGTSRDLGFCSSLRKDGTQCPAWIDTRSTQVCDFHIKLQLDKARSSRMEVNTMFRSTGRRKRSAGSMSPEGSSRGRGGRYINSQSRDPELVDKNPRHRAERRDFDSGERFFLGPAHSSSAVKLLDAADDLGAAEKLRRRLADKEKDRSLMEKLGQLGSGAGAEYMRAARGDRSPGRPSAADEGGVEEVKHDAASLGLIARADQVRLSPVRGRKRAPHEMAEAVGWKDAFKRGVLDKGKKAVVQPEAGQKTLGSILSAGGGRARSVSPKKKARFVLDKGIREPGRESLGDAMRGGAGDDSDDELDII